MRKIPFTLLACFALSAGAVWAQDAVPTTAAAPPDAGALAPAGAIQIALPFNKAIVRESVSVKLRDFPLNGYAAISIDDQFITAQALPKNRTDPVFVWDTKAAYFATGDPNTPKYYGDGPHAITIAVYDAQNKPVGKDTVQVQLANKINMPSSQGIKLAYPWSLSTSLHYQRRTTLTAAPADAATGDAVQTLQESLLRYHRTVENASGGTFLIRDEAQPVDASARPKPFVSYVSTHGLSQSLAAYAVHAKYRVVDTQGHVLSTVGAQNGGEQIGFSLPVLPPRRVSVGEHWESPVQMTLDWASPYPTTVTATSTLEDFEWQDRYPTAKIRETYTGPATFQPRPGSPLPLIQSQDIKFERIIYYAYNSGRIVRMQTNLTLTSTSPGATSLLAAPASPGTGQYPGGPGGYQGGSSPGGYQGGSPGGYGGSSPGSYPGGQYPGSSPSGPGRRRNGGQSPGGYGGSSPGGYQGGYQGGSPGGYQGGMSPGGYQGGMTPGGSPGGGQYPGSDTAAPAEPVAVKLKYTETSVILI